LVDAIVAGVRAGRAGAWPVPLPAGTDVVRLQTHVSTVLLAGGHALKIKKPVAPGFLDFSTLAKREYFFREELRLNRRTAPEFYLDVLAIGGTRQTPHFDGGVASGRPTRAARAEPLEWALWMRRFDEAATFDRLAARGALTPEAIDDLAAAVASFQQAQPASAAPWGEPATSLRWALDNIHALRAGRWDAPDAGRLHLLEDWTRAAFQRLAPLMRSRREAGAVMDGHGDLHLGNIAWVADEAGSSMRALLFDALEFAPELRHLDRMAEVAFPFMDLLDHGLPALAWRFLSQVLEATGDHAGLPLLRWFAVYRALVRAKVAWLQGDAEAARRRIALAVDLTVALMVAREADQAADQAVAARPTPAMLVLACGLPGSGKSTVAAMLVEALGAVRLRSDVERKRLFELAPTERPAEPGTIYNAQATQRTHERLAAGTRAALEGRIPVVVDATFNRRAERDAMRALAADLGVPCRIVECTAPHEVLAERIRRRQAADNDASDAALHVLDLLTRHREPLDADEWPAADRIDTDVTLTELTKQVQAWARGRQR
jgi:hypothetical protein